MNAVFKVVEGWRYAVLSCVVAVTLPSLASGSTDYALSFNKKAGSWLDDAIRMVHGIVPDTEVRLHRVRPNEDEIEEPGSVPVYLVRSSDAQGMVARVPLDCRCVVVGAAEFNEAYESLSSEHSLLRGDEALMLTFLLLHEIGHIANGHYGQFVSRGEGEVNLEESDSKKREEEADEYVATRLRSEVEKVDEGRASLDALELGVFLAQLSLVISTQASIDCFGCRVLGDPQIFWDHSRSHPNFELRLLKINHAVNPTETSATLLRQFERDRYGGRSIIVVSPEGVEQSFSEGSEEFKQLEGLLRDLKTHEEGGN